jgi:hypothetical protein
MPFELEIFFRSCSSTSFLCPLPSLTGHRCFSASDEVSSSFLYLQRSIVLVLVAPCRSAAQLLRKSSCSHQPIDEASQHPHTPIYLNYILMLSFHIRAGLPSHLFSLYFPIKTLNVFPLSVMHAICLVHLILLDLLTQIVIEDEHKL